MVISSFLCVWLTAEVNKLGILIAHSPYIIVVLSFIEMLPFTYFLKRSRVIILIPTMHAVGIFDSFKIFKYMYVYILMSTYSELCLRLIIHIIRMLI